MKTKTKTKTKSNHQASSPDTVSDFSHTKQKHCAHCGTTDTPQWRRAPEGGCLCNKGNPRRVARAPRARANVIHGRGIRGSHQNAGSTFYNFLYEWDFEVPCCIGSIADIAQQLQHINTQHLDSFKSGSNLASPQGCAERCDGAAM